MLLSTNHIHDINTIWEKSRTMQTSWGNIPIDAFLCILAHLQPKQITENHAPKIWLCVPKEEESDIVASHLNFWVQQLQIPLTVCTYPANDADSLQGLSPIRSIPQQRIYALSQWYSTKATIVISSVFASVFRGLSKEDLHDISLYLETGREYDIADITTKLQYMGYLETKDLDSPGTFHHIGDSLHIWNIGETEAIRLSFFDIELEHIHRFAKDTKKEENHCTILPARELVLHPQAVARLHENVQNFVQEKGHGRALLRRIMQDFTDGIWFPGADEYLPSAWNLVNPRTEVPHQFISIDGNRCAGIIAKQEFALEQRWQLFTEEQTPLLSPTARFLDYASIEKEIASNRQINTDGAHLWDIESVVSYKTHQQTIDILIRQLSRLQQEDYTIILVAGNHNRLQRIQVILEHHGITIHPIDNITKAVPSKLHICVGDIQEGFVWNNAKLAIFSVEYILQISIGEQKYIPKTLKDAVISNVAELQAGDFVVHQEHGIGMFKGIVAQQTQDTTIDCLEIEYADNAILRIPVYDIDKIFRYRTMGTKLPKLDKLHSPQWNKKLLKAQEKITAMAAILLNQIAIRAKQRGYSYAGAPQLLQEFALSFPYQETIDQQVAIDDVLRDLGSERPMNRLIIGDVGFGKTEIAMRAAVRVVAEGHQVALLCPTTILAMQHHRSFVERCFAFGIRVALLSRLQTPGIRKKLYKMMQNGEIDIIIATHAMFTKELRFKRLGLVIVDEEHRFGVDQKEKLQTLSQLETAEPVEYLAMSATPIPRTLHMALSGLREVSVITTPPPKRRAIQTRFMRFNMKEIAKQILFELQRGGQIFFVHNVVRELPLIAQKIQEHIPHAKIEITSGKHNKKQLEQVMLNMWNNTTQILVCTTIIENGIDLPNVNTIFINNAHNMGLAQLYQLRGRVGRSTEQGYCTLLIPDNGLSMDSLSRIEALRQYTALGAGFAIASADLEIRGSGDLLGEDQAGHIEAIGLDTYIDLLQKTIQAKQQEDRVHIPQINIPIKATIPVEYIPDLDVRLQSYRKMAISRNFEDLQEILDTWEKQYGPPPQLAIHAVGLAEIRLWAKVLGIDRIDWLKSQVQIVSHTSSPIPFSQIQTLAQKENKLQAIHLHHGLWQVNAKFSYENNQNPLPFMQWVLGLLFGVVPKK